MGLARDEKRARLSAFLSQLPPKTSFKLAQSAGAFSLIEALASGRAVGPAIGAIDPGAVTELWRALGRMHAEAAAGVVDTWTAAAVGLGSEDPRAAIDALADRADAAQLERELAGAGVEAETARIVARLFKLTPVAARAAISAGADSFDSARFPEVAADEGLSSDDAALLLAVAAAAGAPTAEILKAAAAVAKPREAGRMDRPPFRFLLEVLLRLSVEAGTPPDGTPDFELALACAEERRAAVQELSEALKGRTSRPWDDQIAWAAVGCADDFRSVCEAAVDAAQEALDAAGQGGKAFAAAAHRGLGAARFVSGAEACAARLGFEQERSAAQGAMARLLGEPEAIGALMARVRDDDGFAREIVVRELDMRAEHIRALGMESEGRRLKRQTAIAAGRPDFVSAIFAPLEPLIWADDDAEKVPPGWLPRPALSRLWEQTRDHELSADAVAKEAAYQEALRAKDAPRAQAIAAAVRGDFGRALKSVVATESDFAGDAREIAEFIAPLLAAWDDIDAVMRSWPDLVRDFDEDKVGRVRDLHDVLSREPSYVAASLLLLTMRRLAKPWQIFRALERITRQSTDLVMEGTELALVGDALIADAERATTAFVVDEQTPFDAAAVIRNLQLFAGIATGVPEEFGIRRDGALGRKLYELRARGSKLLEQVCKRAATAVEAATPREDRGRHGGRPAIESPPDEDRVSEAVAFAFFLAESKVLDQRAAFGAERVKARHAVQDRLDAHADALLDIAQSDDAEDAMKAQAHLRATARILEAFDGPAAADVLRRRAAAAA